ncbi:Eco57I restriction-modification methylase domain-containing protein [Pseudarthrobacter sulfonivorans]|uniref:Eco57I restriction-modification methylase domain-containing protein n=1 Tax=Pseudarthrobacter sulfonivorans TaxID=121292 RepID=UPI00278B74AE|nr:DNA methyltransferase [Pseudarthrobacter sulfonivorans]MDP9998290.1 methylase of polypeptide subunit release factors [Pseudarthrobacter sulfonivorans]
MPSFDSFVVGEDFVSEHFFTTDTTKAGESFQSEVLKLRKEWDDTSKEGHESPLDRFRKARGQLQIDLGTLAEEPDNAARIYRDLRQSLGFHGPSTIFKAERSGVELLAHDVWSTPNNDVLFVEAQPADSLEDALAKDRGDLIQRPLLDDKEANYSASKLISELFQTYEPPQFIVLMAGRWLILTERERWPEGRYLAADALLAVERNDTKRGGELDRFLAVFGQDSLHPDASEQIWWNGVIESSVRHTVGVSKDLREGIRLSIEIIANDVLTRRTAAGMPNDDVDGQSLARQSLRFLYRILFLLYAEASPEMGVIPVGDEQYDQGYGLDRIRELVLNPITSEKAKRGTHLYDSLNLLFTLVNTGHRPTQADDALTFENLEADLFSPSRTADIDGVKLGNAPLQKVLEHLLLSKEARGKDRGFISYAELGVNQLGAVYEGLMSYTGFIAQEDLHEVAKDGDSSKGSWVVPVTRSAEIEAKHFVMTQDEITGQPKAVLHLKGTFVFRLAGRERQQSASYYTPEVLTKFVVSQALEELLDQDGTTTPADDILKLTVCEPALGSGAFAIEAVRQLADEYLNRKQKELDYQIPADEIPQERQKVKAQIALHQVHGVDLNETAVELAEVSLWLETMVAGLQAPWFGLRLRRGNSLIGARRATYSAAQVKDKSWLTSTPHDAPLTGLVQALEDDTGDPAVAGRVHHFLLPAPGWGAASDAKEVKDLAGDAQKALGAWRKSLRLKPTKQQVDRLLDLSRRVEALWKLALRRLEIAEVRSRRDIDYFGKASVGPMDTQAVSRIDIEVFLDDPNSSYRRLRLVMDAWNALWFWPLTAQATQGAKPPTMDEWLAALEGILGIHAGAGPDIRKYGHTAGQTTAMSQASWAELVTLESFDAALSNVREVATVFAEHPWLETSKRLARLNGFFHWELDFAPIFGRGGFDVQVGNPPWVRPDWDEKATFAEFDPWWQLAEKPTQGEASTKKALAIADVEQREFMCSQATSIVSVREHLTDVGMYPVVSALRPDLYRSFMVRTWASTSERGVVALVHPESHFTEKKATMLRAETYRRLRRHWQFVNELSLFEIDHHVSYGVHVYGHRLERPQFQMAASLYHPDTVARSLAHDGNGPVPGLKDDEGNWDLRPHPERIVEVDETVLAVWADILDEPGTPPIQARMVYPVNRASASVLEKLSKAPRVRDLGLQYSSGWNETTDRKKGYFEVGSAVPASWDDVILQGPHFTVGNPFAKQPNPTMKNNLDWTEVDLEALPEDFIPRTSYQPAAAPTEFDSGYGRWSSQTGENVSVRRGYRIIWRQMASVTGQRTLHTSIIPSGATHISFAAGGIDSRTLAVVSGLWSSVVVDFLVKATGIANLHVSFIDRLPAVVIEPLSSEIRLRVGRLVCMTDAYSGFWEETVGGVWKASDPLRVSRDRRQSMVEIDALAALTFGMTADELCTIYRAQFPVLAGYERDDLYDTNGRKVPGEISKLYRLRGEDLTLEERTWTHPQSEVEYVFEFPFVSYDREEDMRTSYAHFEKLLAEKN